MVSCCCSLTWRCLSLKKMIRYKYKFETHQVFSLKFDDREVSSFHCAKSAPVDFYDCQGNRIRNSANKATVKKSMVTYVERAGGIKLRHETSAFTVKPRGLRFRCKFSAPLSAQPSQQQHMCKSASLLSTSTDCWVPSGGLALPTQYYCLLS